MVGSTSEWIWLTLKGAQGKGGLGPLPVGSPAEDPWPLSAPHPRPHGHTPPWRTVASVFPPLQKGTTCWLSCFKAQSTLLGSLLKLPLPAHEWGQLVTQPGRGTNQELLHS